MTDPDNKAVETIAARLLDAIGLIAATPEERAALRDFPNLQAILAGTVSGRVTEWPLIRAELLRLVRERLLNKAPVT